MSARPLRFLVILLLGGAVARPTPRANAADASDKPPSIQDLAQDGDGVIWGIVPGASNELYRFEREHWRFAPPAGLPGSQCRPLAITRRTDGATVCVWENGSDQRVFSVQRGGNAKVAGSAPVSIPQSSIADSRLFADSKNNVWLTTNSADICRLSPDGVAARLRVIQPEECLARGRPPPATPRPTSGTPWRRRRTPRVASGFTRRARCTTALP